MEYSRLISVVVGSYNGADFLNETVDSILAQTYKNIELILVDDGSKDRTLEIMSALMQGFACCTRRTAGLLLRGSAATGRRQAAILSCRTTMTCGVRIC